MKTIREEWNSYRLDVIPLNAPAVQIQESRRSFYAGAQAMLYLAATVQDDSVSVPEGVSMLEAWSRELEKFAKDVLEGRA